ncbi:MAG: hypothetical protein LBN34_08985 [Clostridiales Family XIII bacterium]|jgi:hypothetical protein|nr:hypothetical protein [Clostridiales Family XIII bacterium]
MKKIATTIKKNDEDFIMNAAKLPYSISTAVKMTENSENQVYENISNYPNGDGLFGKIMAYMLECG